MGAGIERLDVSVYTVPTETPESDGTLAWDATTAVVVEVTAGRARGIGYTYADRAAATFIHSMLRPVVEGCDPMAVERCWDAMLRAIRNQGRVGIAAMSVAAVDAALWDLKAHLLDVALVDLLGAARDAIPAYGSGGFTSYPIPLLERQLAGWVGEGFTRVKMKVGSEPEQDVARVRAARDAIGGDAELFVDANGAYTRAQARAFADAFADAGVRWFEEPVTSDDLEGLRSVRDHAPGGMAIAAGEYAFDLFGFRRLLDAGAVDVLQADATRCAGITGFMKAAALCEAQSVPLSAHTAPALHAHPCCAAVPAVHLEYFFDHVRVERLLFDGTPHPVEGTLRPDRSRAGFGIELRRADAERYAA